MLIRYGHEIALHCSAPTAIVALLSLHPERLIDARRPETQVITPDIPVASYFDLHGNVCRRFVAPAGDISIWTDGVVADTGEVDAVDLTAAELPVAALPDECLLFLMGSRYCETDRLSQTAVDLFGGIQPGWGRVQAICDFVNQHITFGYAHASATRTALDVYQDRRGVCRDYAHLAIAFCRCLNIPARYVNGYLGDIGVPIAGEMDFSAWIEVYLGGRWWTFDPRNNQRRIGRIVVAKGRDAVDVPLINSFGQHTLKSFRVWAYEVPDASL